MTTQPTSDNNQTQTKLINHFKSMSCDDRSERAKLDDEQANDNINNICNHITVVLFGSMYIILAAACIALGLFLLKSLVNVLFY